MVEIKSLNGKQFELNLKTKLFKAKDKVLKTSVESQALINLYDNYCIHKKCLNCGIASAILSG